MSDRFSPYLRVKSDRLLGAVLFFARVVAVPTASVSADYTSSSNWFVISPYLFAVLLNIWLAVTVTLSVSARLQRRLIVARDQAEAANVAKSQFLANMSHEIRTPLNGILGMAQLLQMEDVDKAQQQEFAGTIVSSGKSLLTILNDILDLSKIEAGRMEINEAAFSPTEVVNEVRLLMSELAEAKGLELTGQWRGDAGLRVCGDPLRLRQMLANLVGNAIKFTEKGQVQIDAFELHRDASHMRLQFNVSDTGIGIADADRQYLFKAFSQVDSSPTRRFEGTGLGLSIVRSLAEQMKGEAGVSSEPGQGSRFWFTVQVGLISLDKSPDK